jgi:YidC/Oxa1 family membrane protein insertase
VTLDVSFTNKGTQPIQSGGYYLYLGSAKPVHKNDSPLYLAYDWDAEGKSEHIDTMWYNAKKLFLFFGPDSRPEQTVYTSGTYQIGWAAISNQYFTTVASMQNGAAATEAWAERFALPNPDPTAKPQYGMDSAVRLPAFTVAPGKTVTQSVQLYAGPKFYATLKGLGGGQERIITYFFSFWGMSVFRPVSVFLLNSMNVLHSWTGSYAIAIILLTLCIRGALWPVQNKATASMRQMQALNPRITELKEKYKDDPTRMQTEMMNLYKEYKINPLAGCLPMFVQIPIFFGFYRVLGTAIELRNSQFLWVHDLSQPDTIAHLPALLGSYPINILPMFMAVTMIAQMSMQPKTGDPSQQRMMMFMPLIFIFMCYNFASALALYWTVQNVFSIMQLYVTKSRTAPVPVKLAPAKRRSR